MQGQPTSLMAQQHSPTASDQSQPSILTVNVAVEGNVKGRSFWSPWSPKKPAPSGTTLARRVAEMRAEGRSEKQIKALVDAANGVGSYSEYKQQKDTLETMRREIANVVHRIVEVSLAMPSKAGEEPTEHVGPLTEREDREAVTDRPGRTTSSAATTHVGIPPMLEGAIIVHASEAAREVLALAMERVGPVRKAALQTSLFAVFASLDQLSNDAQAQLQASPVVPEALAMNPEPEPEPDLH